MMRAPPNAPRVILLLGGLLGFAQSTFGAGAIAAQGRAPSDPVAVGLSAITPAALAAHARFLADDLLEGRGTGERGGEIAARYLASQFAALGLPPAGGDGSYYQWVSLAGVTPEASLVVGAQRQTLVLSPGEEFLVRPNAADSVVTADGDVVFVGYGIGAPDLRWDDYEGASLLGRVALIRSGDPWTGDTTRAAITVARYADPRHKVEQAERLGAVGVLLIHDSTTPPTWAALRDFWTGEQVLPDGAPPSTLRFVGWLTTAAARRMVEATGKDFDVMLERARHAEFRPIDVGAHLAVDLRSRLRRFRSPNVVAQLRGADSAAASESVILLAGYNGRGLGPAEERDSIYNGAVDNAMGVAALLGAASALRQLAGVPRRTIIFLAPTASEAQWAGSAAFIASPTIPMRRTAAVITVGLGNVWGPTDDVVTLAGGQSSLTSLATAAARAESLSISSPPGNAFNWLFQSDPVLYAEAGVPILLLMPGGQVRGRPSNWGAAQLAAYLKERHHRPSDAALPTLDYRGLAQQTRLAVRLAWEVSQTEQMPTWVRGSGFPTRRPNPRF